MGVHLHCHWPRTLPADALARLVTIVAYCEKGLYAITVRYAFDCAGTGEAVPFMLAIVDAGAVVDVTGGTLAHPGDSYGTLLEAGK